MKKYIILFVVTFLILVSANTLKAQHAKSTSPVKDPVVSLAPAGESPKPTAGLNRSIPSLPPKPPIGHVLSGVVPPLVSKPAENTLPSKGVEGLKVSHTPVNMDKPKITTAKF